MLAQAAFSTLFVLFGNLNDPRRVATLLRRNADAVHADFCALIAAGRLVPSRRVVAALTPRLMRALAWAAPVLSLLAPLLRGSLPWLVPAALHRILPLDTRKPGMRRGQPQAFRDWCWEGLPMDNQASDVLMWTRFSELWVPLERAGELVSLLRAFFAEPGSVRESLRRCSPTPESRFGPIGARRSPRPRLSTTFRP